MMTSYYWWIQHCLKKSSTRFSQCEKYFDKTPYGKFDETELKEDNIFTCVFWLANDSMNVAMYSAQNKSGNINSLSFISLVL